MTISKQNRFTSPVYVMGQPIGNVLGLGGNSYFVDPVSGSADGDGVTLDTAVLTVAQALSKVTSGNNDVIYLIGNGQAAGSARDNATIAWSVDATHLVGIAAPTNVSQRARVAPNTSTAFSPLITISGDGNSFQNVQFFHGFNDASAQICVNVTGERNYFNNVHIAGMGHATAGDQAGSSSLSLTGDGENLFENCTIGLDTVARSTTNAEIDLKSQAVRNTFRNCLILTFADNAGHAFVKADSALDLDRWILFDRCKFINPVDATATAMTVGMLVHASAGGSIILENSWMLGATDTADNFGNVIVTAGPPTAGTSALAINSA